ncbi:12173_t:CDS:2, partial [Entrophospora sp. SA101]
MRSKVKRRFRAIRREKIYEPVDKAQSISTSSSSLNQGLLLSTSTLSFYEVLGLIDPDIID